MIIKEISREITRFRRQATYYKGTIRGVCAAEREWSQRSATLRSARLAWNSTLATEQACLHSDDVLVPDQGGEGAHDAVRMARNLAVAE